MRKKMLLILSIFVMVLLFSVDSPISYAQTQDEMTLEVKLIGSQKPEVDHEFIIYIESNDASYPMPAGTIDNRYAVKILGEGQAAFPDIDFVQIGDYSYKIYQFIDEADESYEFDATEYQLFVIVTKNETTKELEIHYNLYVEKEDLKTDRIFFLNEYLKDIDDNFIPLEPIEPPKAVIPLTGSVDVYYTLGFASILLALLITTLRKVRE